MYKGVKCGMEMQQYIRPTHMLFTRSTELKTVSGRSPGLHPVAGLPIRKAGQWH